MARMEGPYCLSITITECAAQEEKEEKINKKYTGWFELKEKCRLLFRKEA